MKRSTSALLSRNKFFKKATTWLLVEQLPQWNSLQRLARNWKGKETSSTKTMQYYEERIKKLDAALAEFENTDNKIRCLEELQLDHKYFTENYYQKIEELVTQYRQIFELGINETSKTPTCINKTRVKRLLHLQKQPLTCTSTNAIIGRYTVVISSLRRLLDTDPTATNMQLKEKL